MSGQARAAGWSAAARAQEIRRKARGGPVRRVLRAMGLDLGQAAAEASAGRWEVGARGEELTAELLRPLAAAGWAGFYDRQLPGGSSRANVDHVLIPPRGDLLVLVDAKFWSAKWPVRRGARGQLLHGTADREQAARSLRYEARVLRDRLRVPVVPVMCVHNAPVARPGRFALEGLTVVEAGQLLTVLGQWAGEPDREAFRDLALRVSAALPRYGEREGL